MNFLDPVEWRDLEGLEKQHEVLDEDLVKQLHNRLRPYFLRRIKSEVLQLPPKVCRVSLFDLVTLMRRRRTKSLSPSQWPPYRRRFTDLSSVCHFSLQWSAF